MALNRGNRSPYCLPMKLREPVSTTYHSQSSVATPSIMDQYKQTGYTSQDASKLRKASFASESTSYSSINEKSPSSIERAIQKTKARFSRRSHDSDSLSDDDEELAKMKENAIQKWKKRAESQKLGANDQVKFGVKGAKMNIA